MPSRSVGARRGWGHFVCACDTDMSSGMFPTPGPGVHGGPPRTGMVMWQPQPGVRLVKMNLQGEQAPYPTGSAGSTLCALEDTKSAITKAEMEIKPGTACQVLAGPQSRPQCKGASTPLLASLGASRACSILPDVVPRAMGPWRLLFSCLSKRRKEKVADLGFHGVTSIEPASPAQSKPAAQRPAQLAQEDWTEIEECQNCATVLVPGANFCHHCGWKKGAVKATVVRTEAAEAAQLPGAVPAAKSQAAPATPQQAVQLQSAAAEPAVTPVPKAAGAAPKAEASPAAEGGAETSGIASFRAWPRSQRAIARTPPEAGNYVVELRRQNPAERFGFGWDVKKLEKDNVRVISKVLPGTLAAKWNERPPPGCEVRPGDTLVKVNGKQGRIELLTVELSKMYVVCEFQPHEPRDLGGPHGGRRRAGDKQSDGAPQPSVPEATRPGAAPALAARAAEPVAPMAVATPAGAAAVTLPAAEAVAQLAMATPPAEAGSTLTVAMPAAGSPPPAQPAASSPKPVPAPLTEGEAPEPVLAKDQPPSPAAKDISSPSAKDTDLPPMPDEAPLPPQLPPEPLEAAAVIENPSETPELDHPSNNAAAEPADNAEIAEPKEASREPATGEAEAKNEKPASETTESFYVVVLQRGATSEKWGFQWDRQAMDTLNVKVIEGIAPNSLASDWNRRFPERAARKGDQLTKARPSRAFGKSWMLPIRQCECADEGAHCLETERVQ
eukprot:s1744_g6.t2